jgi:hypothetical protein
VSVIAQCCTVAKDLRNTVMHFFKTPNS